MGKDAAVDSAIMQCKKVDCQYPALTPMVGGFSKTRGWVFGYKLHISCSIGKLAVPLTARITPVNVYDPPHV